jgi:hypothetical protein
MLAPRVRVVPRSRDLVTGRGMTIYVPNPLLHEAGAEIDEFIDGLLPTRLRRLVRLAACPPRAPPIRIPVRRREP